MGCRVRSVWLWGQLLLTLRRLAGEQASTHCLGVHSIGYAGPASLHHHYTGEGVHFAAAYLDALNPVISWKFQCDAGKYKVYVKYSNGALGGHIYYSVKVNGRILLLPGTGSWQEFLWSEALEFELGLGNRTSISIHEVAVKFYDLESGVWFPINTGSAIQFQALSIEKIDEPQISQCMACQILVLYSMLSNVHSSLLTLDGAISPSKRPELWIDTDGRPRSLVNPDEFDWAHVHVCTNTTWITHWSQTLRISQRSIQDTCLQVFLERSDSFIDILQIQRQKKGIAELTFAATFESYCIQSTGICRAEERMSRLTFLDLCGPLWNQIMCAERMERTDSQHGKYLKAQAQQVKSWWSGVISDQRFRGHPFLKRVLDRADFQNIIDETARHGQHQSDSSLPVERSAFLYLCQASQVHILSTIYSLLSSRWSALLVITWKRRSLGALYFPNSTLAEGRQMLFAAARLQERMQGWRYMYWIMLDHDVAFLRGGPREFEAFLSTWEPAIGVPANFWHHARFREYQLETSDAYAAYHVDHQLIAYHHESIDELWPFDLQWDRECWWTSQWYQTMLASVKYKGHVLVSKQVVIVNPQHSTYPKANHKEAYDNSTMHLRKMLPANVRHCARFVDDTEVGQPWGKPLKKNGRYDNWHINDLKVDCSCNTSGQALRPNPDHWPPLDV